MFDATLDHRKRHRLSRLAAAVVTSPALPLLPSSHQPAPHACSQQARQQQSRQQQ
jgi:hypothetical protein